MNRETREAIELLQGYVDGALGTTELGVRLAAFDFDEALPIDVRDALAEVTAAISDSVEGFGNDKLVLKQVKRSLTELTRRAERSRPSPTRRAAS